MIDAQVERRIDGGFYSAAAFAAADSRCGCLEPLVAPRASDGTLAYHAIIVARAGSGIALGRRSCGQDRRGRRGGFDRRAPHAARRADGGGLRPAATFGAVVEVDSAEEAVRLVAAGRADAAFAWSSLAGRVEDGYSRGTLTDLVARRRDRDGQDRDRLALAADRARAVRASAHARRRPTRRRSRPIWWR